MENESESVERLEIWCHLFGKTTFYSKQTAFVFSFYRRFPRFPQKILLRIFIRFKHFKIYLSAVGATRKAE